MFGRILIATDDSPVMENATRYAATLFPDAEYHVLTVVDIKQSKLPKSSSIKREARKLSKSTLGHTADILHSFDIDPY